MKYSAKLTLIPVVLTLLLPSALVAADTNLTTEQRQVLTKEAKGKIKLFAGDLKKTLKQGMNSKGPVEAINLCNTQAPYIAEAHSKNDWTISRTSLKARNPNNVATDWQASILQDFEKRKAAGEPVKQISSSLVRDDTFHFVKAIPTAPLCTTCHGKALAPAIQDRLKELYPNDKATGFSAGDIRGAFIVSKKI